MRLLFINRHSWLSSFQIGFLSLILGLFALISLLCADSGPLIEHPDLKTHMATFLQWSNFWHKEWNSKKYSPGKIVKVTAFYSATQILIYIPEIDVAMSFLVGSKGQLVAEWITLLMGRRLEDMARTRLQAWPQGNPVRGSIEDHFPPKADSSKNYEVFQFSFKLPQLTIPDCIKSKTVSKELPSLKKAVQQAMIEWLCPEGEPLPEATIPYFDSNDPWIYVVVDGDEFHRGYFIFLWRDGKWIPDGKPWWPEGLGRSSIISLAQQHALATVNAKCHQ